MANELPDNAFDFILQGEVCQILGVSRARVRQLTVERKLTCIRLNRGLRLYFRDQVEDVRAKREEARRRREERSARRVSA